MGRLDGYIVALRASIADLEKSISSIDELLMMHEKYCLTDAEGEAHLRADLTAQSTLLHRYRKYLDGAEAQND